MAHADEIGSQPLYFQIIFSNSIRIHSHAFAARILLPHCGPFVL
jgi:hypothetical protein